MKNSLLIFAKIIVIVLFFGLYFCLLLNGIINLLTFLLGIFNTLLFSVIIHEISHLICAIIIGLKNYDLEISVFGIKKNYGKLKICFANNNIFHGSCSCDYNSNISLKNYSIFCRIGGFSNLIVLIISLIIIFLSHSSILRFHMLCQALTSLYDFSLNCIFKKSSDMRLLKSIIKRKENN